MAFKMKYNKGGFPFKKTIAKTNFKKEIGENDGTKAYREAGEGLTFTGEPGLAVKAVGEYTLNNPKKKTAVKAVGEYALKKSKPFKKTSPFTHRAEGDDEHAKQHQKALERRRNKKKKKILQKNIGKYKFPTIT